MCKISNRHIKAWQMFNDELNAFIKEVEDDPMNEAVLYEDATTSRKVRDFEMTKFGSLTWVEDGKTEQEFMYDEDDAREWLKFWKSCLRRAKRYWEMDAVELDRLQDGEVEENED